MTRDILVERTDAVVKIDAAGVYYRQLNACLRELVADGAEKIELHNVCGQRYIGTGQESRSPATACTSLESVPK